mmetsp:Transcript_29851/g.91617  ORF Transcript_29851/g.91617 Transcript_29851/m.91617 type:complete len:162 (+) Transcript_29851:1005-1490(+)
MAPVASLPWADQQRHRSQCRPLVFVASMRYELNRRRCCGAPTKGNGVAARRQLVGVTGTCAGCAVVLGLLIGVIGGRLSRFQWRWWSGLCGNMRGPCGTCTSSFSTSTSTNDGIDDRDRSHHNDENGDHSEAEEVVRLAPHHRKRAKKTKPPPNAARCDVT